MGYGDDPGIAAHGGADIYHLREAAGHGREVGGDPVVAGEAPEEQQARGAGECDIDDERAEAHRPLAEPVQDRRGEAAAQHDAEHHDEEAAQGRRHGERQPGHGAGRGRQHGADHPGERQLGPGGQRAAEAAQGDGPGQAQPRPPRALVRNKAHATTRPRRTAV